MRLTMWQRIFLWFPRVRRKQRCVELCIAALLNPHQQSRHQLELIFQTIAPKEYQSWLQLEQLMRLTKTSENNRVRGIPSQHNADGQND